MTRSVPRSPASLAPVDLTPEEAAAIAVALAAQPTGPYSVAGRRAQEKVLAALEPDPRRRSALLASSRLVRAEADQAAEVRSVLEQGLTLQRLVRLRYRSGAGVVTDRD